MSEFGNAVLAAERRRCAAMLASDAVALDAITDAGLSFCHTTGRIEDKAAWCATIAAGKIAYIAINWPEQRVERLGPDAAMLTGRMSTRVRIDGVEKLLDNRVITIWRRDSDAAWRLLAFQSTPIRS